MFKFIKNLFTNESKSEYDVGCVFYSNMGKLSILEDLYNIVTIKGLTMDDVRFKVMFEIKDNYYINVNIHIKIGDYNIFNDFEMEKIKLDGLIDINSIDLSMDVNNIRIFGCYMMFKYMSDYDLIDNIIRLISSFDENIFEIKKSLFEIIKDDIDKYNNMIERKKYINEQIHMSILDKNFNK